MGVRSNKRANKWGTNYGSLWTLNSTKVSNFFQRYPNLFWVGGKSPRRWTFDGAGDGGLFLDPSPNTRCRRVVPTLWFKGHFAAPPCHWIYGSRVVTHICSCIHKLSLCSILRVPAAAMTIFLWDWSAAAVLVDFAADKKRELFMTCSPTLMQLKTWPKGGNRRRSNNSYIIP